MKTLLLFAALAITTAAHADGVAQQILSKLPAGKYEGKYFKTDRPCEVIVSQKTGAGESGARVEILDPLTQDSIELNVAEGREDQMLKDEMDHFASNSSRLDLEQLTGTNCTSSNFINFDYGGNSSLVIHFENEKPSSVYVLDRSYSCVTIGAAVCILN